MIFPCLQIILKLFNACEIPRVRRVKNVLIHLCPTQAINPYDRGALLIKPRTDGSEKKRVQTSADIEGSARNRTG